MTKMDHTHTLGLLVYLVSFQCHLLGHLSGHLIVEVSD